MLRGLFYFGANWSQSMEVKMTPEEFAKVVFNMSKEANERARKFHYPYGVVIVYIRGKEIEVVFEYVDEEGVVIDRGTDYLFKAVAI